jgi:hypothetical protein
VDRERIAPSPSTQTGLAVLPHPAFQFVASDELAQVFDSRRSEESHQPRGLASRSPGFQAVHCWVGSGFQAGYANASVRTASRHYTDPCGMESRCDPTPRPCPPSLHGRYPLLRYYEGSDPGRPFCHRPWFPDSRHSNFRTFHLQSSVGLHQPRSTPSALAALFRYGLRRGYAGSPVPPTESSSLCSLYRESSLRTARSFPVALHPGLWPRRGYFQLLALQCRPGQGLSPCCSSALSGAHSPAFQRRVRWPDITRPVSGTDEERGTNLRLLQPFLRDLSNGESEPGSKLAGYSQISLRESGATQSESPHSGRSENSRHPCPSIIGRTRRANGAMV